MEDTGLPQILEDLPELSALSTDEIPEAIRDDGTVQPVAKQPQTSVQAASSRKPLLWSLGGLGIAVLIAVPLILVSRWQSPSASSTSALDPAVAPSETATPAPDSQPQMLGHFPYEEAPATSLKPISGSNITLRKVATEKFEEMVSAAADDGIVLVPLSGFRSIKEQEAVFFDVKAARGEGAMDRASVSAPPGYSEHHTGYAVDVGDGDAPSTDLQFEFEETKAFKWLKENAAYYSFEISFPKNNPQGVSYEPWHWRFVGDRESLETFYRARHSSKATSETGAITPAGSSNLEQTENLEQPDSEQNSNSQTPEREQNRDQ